MNQLSLFTMKRVADQVPLRVEDRMIYYLEQFFRIYPDLDLKLCCLNQVSLIQQISGRNPRSLVGALIWLCGTNGRNPNDERYFLLPQTKIANILKININSLRSAIKLVKNMLGVNTANG